MQSRRGLVRTAIASPQSGTKPELAGLAGKKYREDAMANLIIQDAFEPYYAGRDGDTKAHAKLQAATKKAADPVGEAEIILPSDPAPRLEHRPRDSRRAIHH
jgi:hypothetical protein